MTKAYLLLNAGLYLGLAVPLAGAFVIGAGLPFALHLGAGAGAGALAALGLAGIGLSLACSAMASWMALRTDDRLRGVGYALGAWFTMTILYDGIVLAASAMFDAYPLERPLLGLMLVNPVDVARVLVLTQLDVSALMGYTGAIFQRTFGTGAGTTVAVAALMAWCGVPLAFAARSFRRRDF